MLLGAIQGPTEWLPVSSSGHVALLPTLLGWPYACLDPGLRKSFEVILHAGAGVGLAVALRRDAPRSRQDVARLVLSAIPAGVLGTTLEHQIEERLGGPRSIAAGQVAAGVALWVADLRPATRGRTEASRTDALVIGLAQAAALVPGVSRSGAALTGARLRGFDRRSSAALSREAALPLILGASALKGVRLAREGLSRDLVVPFLTGALTALTSTIVSSRLARIVDDSSSFAPFAVYRLALAGLALLRLPGHGRRIRLNGGHG